jgi:glyoxylase-like metal-dependent hydrolase (beta-lactamase superfamily II)
MAHAISYNGRHPLQSMKDKATHLRENAMMPLTRRHMLAGAAAATAATPLLPFAATSARAAAPQIGKQAPSFYRSKLGDFEITVVGDGARAVPLPPTFVRNVPIEQVLAVAEAAYMPKGSIVAPFNPIVVNTGAKLVLIDTGYGPGIAPTVGLLPANLAAAGIDAKSIDVVLISHMHGDHILGLKHPDGSLAFPNAEIKVPAIDWAFWMSDENMGKAPEGFQKTSFGFNRKIFSNLTDKVTRFEWGKEVAPGITAIDTSGHTPGHTAFAIASGSARLIFQGDVSIVPDVFLRNPDWQVMFDSDPEKAVQTRRRFYDMVSADKTLVSGYHFPFPGFGYIEKAGAGYRLVPAAWNPTL